MAGNDMAIDTSRLGADIRELRENKAKAKNSLDEMMAELSELNAMWKGSANLAFQNQTAKDYELTASLLSMIEKLADSMENARQEYVKCEQSVKSAVNGIRI